MVAPSGALGSRLPNTVLRRAAPASQFWSGGTPIVCVTDVALGRALGMAHNVRGPFEMYTALTGTAHAIQFRSILSLNPPDPKAGAAAHLGGERHS